MSPDPAPAADAAARARSWRKVALFYGLVLALSAPLQVIIIQRGMMQSMAFVVALMWCPAVAAITTQLLFRDGLGALGWRPGPARYLALGYVLPLAYAVPVYALAWLLGAGGFPNPDMLAAWAKHFGLEGAATATLVAAGFGAAATMHVATSMVVATGEEIGWRGFLVPELMRVTDFARAALISGLLWSAWHSPVLIFGDYNKGAPAWFALPCFVVLCVGLSSMMAWLRLRSGSLWPAALMHATHNVFIQAFLTPLTVATALTPWILDEFGVGLATTAALGGWLAWRAQARAVAP